MAMPPWFTPCEKKYLIHVHSDSPAFNFFDKFLLNQGKKVGKSDVFIPEVDYCVYYEVSEYVWKILNNSDLKIIIPRITTIDFIGQLK